MSNIFLINHDIYRGKIKKTNKKLLNASFGMVIALLKMYPLKEEKVLK